MSYTVTVTKQPARRLVGLSARVNMRDTHKECTALWEKFMPMMGELTSVAEEGSFGASINMEENGDFDYWAAMALPQDAKVPSGMGCLEARGGKYAECVAESLENIGAVYEYIYGEWGKTQNDHSVDYTAACLEFYHKDWKDGGPVTLYIPLN